MAVFVEHEKRKTVFVLPVWWSRLVDLRRWSINRPVGICHTIYHPRVLLFLLILLLSLPRMQKDSPDQSLKSKFCLSCKVKCHSMELSLASVWKSASPPTTPMPSEHFTSISLQHGALSVSYHGWFLLKCQHCEHITCVWFWNQLNASETVPGRGSVNICRRSKWLVNRRGYL